MIAYVLDHELSHITTDLVLVVVVVVVVVVLLLLLRLLLLVLVRVMSSKKLKALLFQIGSG